MIEIHIRSDRTDFTQIVLVDETKFDPVEAAADAVEQFVRELNDTQKVKRY